MSENPESEQDQAVPIIDAERDLGPSQKLMLARAAAIQGYANLEQSMLLLFAILLGTDHEIAGIIFFRMVNARSRITVLEDLLKKRHGDKYGAFWNSVAKLIQTMDSRRNEIIHWHVSHNLNLGGKPESTFTLVPPNFWRASSAKAITASDLNDFFWKCDFSTKLLNVFALTIGGHHPPGDSTSWLEIFQQPVIYPPIDTHPLSRKRPAP